MYLAESAKRPRIHRAFWLAVACALTAVSCASAGRADGDRGPVSTQAATTTSTSPVETTTTTTEPPRRDIELDHGALTSQDWQSYGYRTDGDSVTISAPGELDDTNVREVFWPAAGAPHRDDQVCLSWDTDFDFGDDPPLQPGIALRIESTGDQNQGLRAITVTENIWLFGVWLFNVHVWDTLQPQPMTLLHTWDLSEVVAPGASGREFRDYKFVEPPWNMCGRTDGDVVSFKVWAQSEREPSWDDPRRVFSTPLPPGWDNVGYFGGYIGHLHPGQSATTRITEGGVTD